MLQKEIEIQELTFIQVNIFGCYLPSNTAIKSVLDRISDKRNKAKICKHSNHIVIAHSQRFDMPVNYQYVDTCKIRFRVVHTDDDIIYNLRKVSSMIMAHQCVLSGCDFNFLAQNLFTVNWFEGVCGGFDLDIQRLERMSGHWLGCIRDRGKSMEKYASLKPELPSQRMSQHSEYMVARAINESFNTKIFEVARYDNRMRGLLYEDLQIMHDVFRRTAGIKDKTIITVCTECNLPFESKQMPCVKICKLCNSKQKEKKDASRRIPRRGWMFEKTGFCTECADEKRIDEHSLCWKCYQKKYP
jgi:hypothetical protein